MTPDITYKSVSIDFSDESHDKERPGEEFDSRTSQKRLLRKLDFNLLPFLSFLYLLSFLDRTNIGNAKLDGLEDDLGLKGNQFNTALSVFFYTYVAAEIPSNLALKRLRPSIWIPTIMLAWGTVMTLMGLVNNFAGLVTARVFLGLTEAGLFPGVTYYISLWYRRSEIAVRIAIFFSAATVAGAFGGVLAFGITKMDGIGGKAGWAWIFILEGLLTVVVAIASYFVINDFPETARFLTLKERKEVSRRLREDSNDLASHFDWKFFWQAVWDWKIYLQCIIYWGCLTSVYAFSLFLPTIIRNLGYSSTRAQLMSVPPYVLGCCFTVIAGLLSDRYKVRGPFAIGFLVIGILGYSMLYSLQSARAQYTATIIAACGIFPTIPVVITWNSNNIGGSVKRGVGMAMQIGFGNLGGAVASYIYRRQDAPRFLLGHCVILSFLCLSCIVSAGLLILLHKENQRRDQLPVEDNPEKNRQYVNLGDQAPFFRYTL